MFVFVWLLANVPLSFSLSEFVNYPHLTKLTENSNTDGIRDLCNYFSLVCRLYSLGGLLIPCSVCVLQISIGKKFNLIFFFFLLRKLILPFNSFTLFFCIILPMTIFVPKTELPAWVVCYIPATMSFLNILPAPNSFSFIVPFLLFENTMSVTKFNAMVSGLFQLGSAYE